MELAGEFKGEFFTSGFHVFPVAVQIQRNKPQTCTNPTRSRPQYGNECDARTEANSLWPEINGNVIDPHSIRRRFMNRYR